MELAALWVFSLVTYCLTRNIAVLVLVLVSYMCIMISEGKTELFLSRSGISAARSEVEKDESKDDVGKKEEDDNGTNKHILKSTANPQYAKKDVNDKKGEPESESTKPQSDDNTKQNIQEESPANDKSETTNNEESFNNEGLRQTINPNSPSERAKRQAQQNQKKSNDTVDSVMDHVDYTIDGMQKKMDKFIFTQTHFGSQSTDQRARFLNSLYMDFSKESKRQDPYLKGEKSTGCEQIKGRLQSVKSEDC